MNSSIKGTKDSYGGFIVDSYSTEPDTFKENLLESLSFWSSEGIKGVWLKIQIENSNLISIAAEVMHLWHLCDKLFIIYLFFTSLGSYFTTPKKIML
jgi:hypothetical protein